LGGGCNLNGTHDGDESNLRRYLEHRDLSLDDLRERRLDRLVREWFLGLPPLPRRWAA
jgi:hypothetical protein